MNEKKPVPTVNSKSENFSSEAVTEYQYVPFTTSNGNFVAVTFFNKNVEADLSSNDPKIVEVRKAICTLSIDIGLAKQLAIHLQSLPEISTD